MSEREMEKVDRAIAVLETKGFDREAFILRHLTTFRASDNWLNSANAGENAYAATNFPFGIITLGPDFYTKATDDTDPEAKSGDGANGAGITG